MPRETTTKIIEQAECGALSWEGIAHECLQRMSEDDVKDMAMDMDWIPECPGYYRD